MRAPPARCARTGATGRRRDAGRSGSRPMKGLLIGYGSIGRRHLANLHDLGVDEWAVVHTGKGTLALEPPCPVTVHTDLGEALRVEKPAFAVVANPTNLHASTTRSCIEAGCAVLLEKPVSHALD